MKFYGKADETAKAIIDRFQNGDVPGALAQVFVDRSDHVPSSAWSFNNRFIQAIHGTNDARGFKQWKDSGRSVKKGAKSFRILGPCTRTIENDEGEKRSVLYGFKGFRYSPSTTQKSPTRSSGRKPAAWTTKRKHGCRVCRCIPSRRLGA